MWSVVRILALVVSAIILPSACQRSPNAPLNSFPQDYPGKPQGAFETDWQEYFLVTNALPNVSFPLPRNWAGNIPVNRPGHPNDTLFFWAFENTNGSLTAAANENADVPWGIWLNGGPGASSMLGMMAENGPLQVTANFSLVSNAFSWDKLLDYIWIDQPVGTGFSTADADGYITDEDQMGEDFVGFLTNLVAIFPSLASRPLFLTGESYAGTFIPYIAKTLFSMPQPPVRLNKIVIGNGAIGSVAEFGEMPALSVIETFPQLINYDPDVYNYFVEQTHLCGYDLNITYPQQGGLFPSLTTQLPADEGARAAYLASMPRSVDDRRARLASRLSRIASAPAVDNGGALRKRDGGTSLSGRANGSIDPFYGCFLSDEVEDYALNFSMPFNESAEVVIQSLDAFGPFNVYDIPDARSQPVALDPTVFLNDNRTRAALHAPTSKDWILQIVYPFGSTFEIVAGANPYGDPSVEPMSFFSELASNASAHNVSITLYSGNDDTVVAHRATEIIIQNTTFGGVRGFTKQPQTAFNDDNNKFAGIVHQERNWTYALFSQAGHEVPEYQPEAAFVFYREFVLGNNDIGQLMPDGTIVNGDDAADLLQGDILPGQSDLTVGSGTATSTIVYPSATIAAWESFFASVVSPSSTHTSNGAPSLMANGMTIGVGLALVQLALLYS